MPARLSTRELAEECGSHVVLEFPSGHPELGLRGVRILVSMKACKQKQNESGGKETYRARRAMTGRTVCCLACLTSRKVIFVDAEEYLRERICYMTQVAYLRHMEFAKASARDLVATSFCHQLNVSLQTREVKFCVADMHVCSWLPLGGGRKVPAVCSLHGPAALLESLDSVKV